MTLLVVVLGAAAYAGALPLYLLFRVSRPALALGAASEAITTLNAQLTWRDSALHQAVRIVHALARAASPRPDSLALARRLLVAGHEPLHVPPDAPIPSPLQVEVARIDETLSSLGDSLAEIVIRLAQGQRADVATRLAAIDRLVEIAQERRIDGNRVARAYLIERQAALRAAENRARRDTVVWLRCGGGRRVLVFVGHRGPGVAPPPAPHGPPGAPARGCHS